MTHVHATPRAWTDRLRWLLAPPLAVTLAACALALFARRPESWLNPQFWAEDAYFYERAYAIGGNAFLLPYSGYFHLIPRIVAALSVQLDPRWVPAFFVACSGVLTLYVAARTQSSRSPIPRLAASALAVVLVPDAFEVLHNIVNIQWVLAGGLMLLLLSDDPRRPSQYAHDFIAAVLLGLTGPFSVMLAPLFLWRAAVRRTRASYALAATVVLCGAVQAWAIWRDAAVAPEAVKSASALLAVPGMRIVGALVAGCFVPPDFPRAVEVSLGLLMLGGVGVLALHRGPSRAERGWLAGAILILLGGSLFRCRHLLHDLPRAGFCERYFFHVYLGCLWLLLLSAREQRRWISISAGFLFAWAVAINLPRLRERPLVDYRWSDYVDRIRAGEWITVPINPTGWKLVLPPRPPAKSDNEGP
jgi:hypothetical protein